ncbi:hypothetical protein K523DRAFT_415192 [Schizophyllum commune Tattone D]|nr:hypothetical protein K523DRAFT_415192 [Schizophyllum commune Tattone D]
MASSANSRPHLKRRADDDLPGPSVKRPRSRSPSNRSPPPSGHGRGTPAKVTRRSLDGSPVPGPSHEPHADQDADDPPVMPVDYFTPIYPSTENPYAPTGYGVLAPMYPQPPLSGPSAHVNIYLNAAVASFEAALMGGYYGPVPCALPPLACPPPLPGYPAPLPGYPAPYPVYYPPYPIYGPPAPPAAAGPAAQPFAPAPHPHDLAPQPFASAVPQPHAHVSQPQSPAPQALPIQAPTPHYYDAFAATPHYYDAFAATPTPTERMDAEALRDAYPGEYPEIPRIYPIRVSSPPERVPELVPDVVRELVPDVVRGARVGGGAGRVAGDEVSIHGGGPSATPGDEPSAPASPDPFTPLTPAEVIQHTLRAREEAPPWYECISRWRETVQEGEGEDPSARLMPKTPVRHEDTTVRHVRATRVHDSRQTRLPTPQPPYTGPFNPPYDVDEAACRLPAARVPFSKDPRLRDWRRPVGVGVGAGARASQPVSVDPPVSVEPGGEGLGEEMAVEESIASRPADELVAARTKELVEARTKEPIEARTKELVAARTKEPVDAFAAELDQAIAELVAGRAARLIDARADEVVEGRAEELANAPAEPVEAHADEVVEAHADEVVEARADEPGEAATGEPLVPRSYAQQLERQVAVLQANAAEQEKESANEVARLEANVAELEANVAELADDRAQFRGVLAAAEDDVADLGEELLFSRRLAGGARAALAGCRYQFEKMRMRLEDVERERDELKGELEATSSLKRSG